MPDLTGCPDWYSGDINADATSIMSHLLMPESCFRATQTHVMPLAAMATKSLTVALSKEYQALKTLTDGCD